MEKIIFNLNFDDFHPQRATDGQDFGGDKENGLFGYIKKLIDEFPDIKITMFTVPDWTDRPDDAKPLKAVKHLLRLNYHHSWKDEPFRLDKHPEWVSWVNEYVKRGNLEIAVHGLFHHTDKSWAHTAEFDGMGYTESLVRIKRAEEIMKNSGLQYVRGFRPPGWGKSEGMLKALADEKFDFVSLYGTPSKGKEITLVNGLINIPQNYSILEKPEEGTRMAKECGRVYAKGHFAPKHGGIKIPNGLTEENYNNLAALIRELKKNYEVEFLSMSEITQRFRKGEMK
jgi:predicted deacetylase